MDTKIKSGGTEIISLDGVLPSLLLIRLAVDEQTAYSRKPDHNRVRLREKIALTSHLNFNGAEILDLDGREPAAQVLEKSLFAIRAHCL